MNRIIRIQEVKPSLYAIALVRQTYNTLKWLVTCLNFTGDLVEHSSATFDGPPNRGELWLRNDSFTLVVESGSTEVAEGPKYGKAKTLGLDNLSNIS